MTYHNMDEKKGIFHALPSKSSSTSSCIESTKNLSVFTTWTGDEKEDIDKILRTSVSSSDKDFSYSISKPTKRQS